MHMRKSELVLLHLFWSALDAVHFLQRHFTFIPTEVLLKHKCFSCCFAASKLSLSPLSQNSRLGAYHSLGGTQPNLIEEPLHNTARLRNASSKRGQMRNIHNPLPKGNAYFPKQNHLVSWKWQNICQWETMNEFLLCLRTQISLYLLILSLSWSINLLVFYFSCGQGRGVNLKSGAYLAASQDQTSSV